MLKPAGARTITQNGIITAAVFLVALGVYSLCAAPTLSWRNGGADGGDLVTAAANVGLPHPTGYPTYLFVAQAFLRLPFGDEAYRLNLMSAVFGAGAVAGLYALLAADSAAQPRTARLAALGAALFAGLTPLWWSQSTIAEVYTLHLFLLVLAAALARRWWQSHAAVDALCLGLVAGLGLGNHLTFVLFLPVVAVALIMSRFRNLWPLLAGLCAGLCGYLYLPLIPSGSSYLHWGRLDSAAAIWYYISGELYRGYLFSRPLSDLPGAALALGARTLANFQWLGIALAGAGVTFECSRAPRLRPRLWLGLWVLLASFGFALVYNTTDSFVYLLPAWLVLAWWMQRGLEWLLAQPRARLVVGAALPAWLVLTALIHWPSLDASADRSAEQFALGALNALPRGAVLISAGDEHTFALWYFSEVRHVRDDVVIVDRDLFGEAQARASLQARWPSLRIGSDDRIDHFISDNRAEHSIYVLGDDRAAGGSPTVWPEWQPTMVSAAGTHAPE